MQKVEIISFLMALVCNLERVGTLCNLCFIMMLVFGRISVEWRNWTMTFLAYRAVLAPKFVEKASLILVNRNYVGIILTWLNTPAKSRKKNYVRHF